MKKIIGMLVGLMMAGCGGNVVIDEYCSDETEQTSLEPCVSCDQMLHNGFDYKNDVDVNFCPDSFMYWEKIQTFICFPINGQDGLFCNEECQDMFCTSYSKPNNKCTDCILNHQNELVNDALIACSNH